MKLRLSAILSAAVFDAKRRQQEDKLTEKAIDEYNKRTPQAVRHGRKIKPEAAERGLF